ncbi:DUF2500 domain-containing protein [Erwinia pyrifoliae]|uniref:DUF2500 domain-containing protein n=1 Tax=Erwinia pyrifoliae TaxID=79967 RepID=UPI00059E0FD8|nr:DUF2500 domain-containing protein [Erwinia pyrifoliae]
MKPPIFFLIILVIIAILATRQFIKQRREVAVNDVTPLRSLIVEVKSKREYPASNRLSRQREHIPVEDMRYEAWFHPLNEAGDFKLELNAGDYHQMDKGTRGELQFKGTRFVSFKPGAEARRN